MLDKNKLVKMTNRSGGSAGYKVPDLGISRFYEYNETKEVTAEEILKLSYSIGGRNLLDDCFIIEDEEVVKTIYGEVEPEYFYTSDDIKELLENGSLDQLQDCLNFASEGVLEILKKIAVEIELNDYKKRQLIFEKMGFNITKAIEVKKATEDEDAEDNAPKRKAEPIHAKKKDNETSTRKSTPINASKKEKYKIVEQ